MNAADTNVFVYAFDHDEVVKQPKAAGLLDHLAKQPGETVFLWQLRVSSLTGCASGNRPDACPPPTSKRTSLM
jgi:hypothetical protein